MQRIIWLPLALLLAGPWLAGCASDAERRKAAQGSASPADATVDEIYARRFALEGFEERLDQTRTFYGSGSGYLFRASRDSLVADVNSYIRANPHCENDPDFARLLNSLSALDTLAVEPLPPDGYAAIEDSIALHFADWPEMDVEMDPGLFSRYNTVFPTIDNSRVDFWIKYFTGPGRQRFERAVYRMQLHRPTVEAILDELDLPREIICIALVESGFSMRAVSSARAVGPWQFMRGTARLYGLRVNWWVDERRDIVASTYAASHYLKDLHGIWGDWLLAFAAYNCGEYRVARQIARQRTEDFWRLKLPVQTQRYVPKFLAALYILRDPIKYDLTVPDVEPMTFDLVTIPDATDLKLIAESADASVEVLRELNPQVRRWATPPGMEVVVKVPPGRGEECRARLDSIPPDERITWRQHRVKRGETLSQIARRYSTSVSALKSLNNIRNSHVIREGTVLLVPLQGGKYVEVASSKATSKPQYMNPAREINKQSLQNYAQKAAPPAGHKRVTYTVRSGDTLGEIAERYRTSARKIRSWNELHYRRYIYPGQKLAIYVPDSFFAPDEPVGEVTLPDEACCIKYEHVVRRGESFYSISRKYGVGVSELLAWNNRGLRSTLHPGDVLEIWKRK
jgi:membrane-bound lytic murein transglycosylase D